MQLGKALDLFYTARIADGASSATVRWYKQRLKRLGEFFGDCTVEALGVDDLREFVVHLRSKSQRWADHPYRNPSEGGLSSSTVRGYVRAVKRFFNWLEQEEILSTERNPALRLKLPRRQRQAPKAISLEDMRRLLKTAKGESRVRKRDYAMLLFLGDTGCRVSGLIGLKVSDVDFQQGMALVTEKGGKSRFVMFTEYTANALKGWLAVRPEVEGEWVFLSWQGWRGKGKPLTVEGVNQVLKRLKTRAGVKGPVNPHSFRHGFARQYLINGGDLASLSDLMGHADVQVTKEFYSVFLIDELKRKHQQNSPVTSMMAE